MNHLFRTPRHLRRSRLDRALRREARSTRIWLAIAGLIAAAGIVSSIVGAALIAKNERDESREALEREATEIAFTLTRGIERHEAFLEGVKGYLATAPSLDAAAFNRWARAVRWRERYPELLAFGLVVPVARRDLREFLARWHAERPPGSPGEAPAPPGERDHYCLGALGQAREHLAPEIDPGQDYCSGTLGVPLNLARDTGKSFYYPLTIGSETGVGIMSPLYSGAPRPTTLRERRDRFIGWVGLQVAQGRLLADALIHHPGVAARAVFKDIGASATFSSGSVPEGGESVTRELSDSWTLTVIGPAAASLWDSIAAVAVLSNGIALSLLAGILIFVLGTGRARALRRVEAATQELRHRALHDPLTGLPNRALIMDRAEHLLARSRRTGTEGAALFIDLDDFKAVNDTLGHEVGDRLLAAVAERLRGALRDADTIGRIGGDEFVVLIDGGELPSAPEIVARRLVEAMRQPFELAGVATPLTVTMSVGVAKGGRESAAELLRDADVALYEAKAAGSDCFAVFDPEMRHEVSHRIEIELDLRSALERGQFRLVYQPIYDLNDLSILGVEALLRWDHPSAGTIAPSMFIPILERTGQIRSVGRWVLEESTRQAMEWHRAGHPLDLAVNISARHLANDQIVADVGRALERSGLDPEHLILEITETALVGNVDATARRLQAIKDLGVRIAVDDFGTGYSSLAYLRELPVDCLKIDRAFTSEIGSSAEADALISTLAQLGRDLGLLTLAEGIERAGQIDRLRAEHVNAGQGYLLSRPLEPERLEELLLPAEPKDATDAPGLTPPV